MLATQIRQKEGAFYFIAYKAADLLDRVRFTSRYYYEGERIEAEEPGDDEVAAFITGIEKSEKAFQRLLNRQKVRQIVNFYETAVSQPLDTGHDPAFHRRSAGIRTGGIVRRHGQPERAARQVSDH